jgi:cytochrome c-type biogenesis protein CcmH/NrfG
VVNAYNLYANDAYVRDLSQYHLQALGAIAAKGTPSPAEVEQFNALTAAALEAASTAIAGRSSDARNWAARADIYTLLARIQIEGAADRAKADYDEAKRRDPQNPYYDFMQATLEAGRNNADGARTLLGLALQKKPNYTEALSALAELDVVSGNLSEAIKTTESILSIEANNPGRYYQLGVLQQANGNNAAAIAAFEDAVTLDPQYANARYLLALVLLQEKQVDAALTQLRVVRDLNPANQVLDDAIARLERGESVESILGQGNTAVTEPAPSTADGTVDTAAEVPDSDLLTPVNVVPDQSEAPEGAQ